MSVSIERLQALLRLEGNGLAWIVSKGKARAGATAGCRKHGRYLQVGVEGKQYLVHRVVWAIAYGSWPDGDLDHINGDTADNRLENLRVATRSQNQWNKRASKSSKTGIKGVRMIHNGRFRAQIQAKGVELHLGYFDSAEAAGKAYDRAAKRLHGEFASATDNDVKLRDVAPLRDQRLADEARAA
jgi:hypothetical protein